MTFCSLLTLQKLKLQKLKVIRFNNFHIYIFITHKLIKLYKLIKFYKLININELGFIMERTISKN